MSALTTLPLSCYVPDAFAGFRPAADFDLGIARAMMWMSQLAYETVDPDKVAAIGERWGLRTQVVDGARLGLARTQAVVARRADGTAIVAFAGTDPVEAADWVSDFDCYLDPATGVARGYQRAAAVVMGQLAAMLDPAAPLFVAGHSLGGALAVVASGQLAAGGIRPLAVHTFGMPRAGSAAFAARYDAALGSCTYRLVHGDDMVPTVAPSFLGFRHVGRYLSCLRGMRFDGGAMAAAGASDEPAFRIDGIGRLTGNGLPVGAVMEAFGLDRTARRLASVALDFLPSGIRDHLPDRYLAGFGDRVDAG